jgi:hypothetical protein
MALFERPAHAKHMRRTHVFCACVGFCPQCDAIARGSADSELELSDRAGKCATSLDTILPEIWRVDGGRWSKFWRNVAQRHQRLEEDGRSGRTP